MSPKLSDKLNLCSLEQPKIMEIFSALETTLEASGSEQAAITLGFVKDPDQLEAGELLPTITFTLTRYQLNPQTD